MREERSSPTGSARACLARHVGLGYNPAHARSLHRHPLRRDLRDCLSVLQRVSRREGAGAGRFARDPCALALRRAELLPREPVGPVRQPFLGDRGGGAAYRSGARRAVRLRAGLDLAGRRLLPWRRDARPHHAVGLDPPRGQVARGDRTTRDRVHGRHHRGAGDSLHHHHRACRSRSRGRQRAGGECVGCVHDCHDHSHRGVHGALHVRLPQGSYRRGDDGRRDHARPGCHPGQAVRGVPDGRDVRAHAPRDHTRDGHLRDGGVGPACLAAARPARTSELVHEDRHGRVPRDRRHLRQSPTARPCGQPVRCRRRSDHPGLAVPVRLHHHRVRCDVRVPRPDRYWYDAEDDRQGERHPADRLRCDAGRRGGRGDGADCRDRSVPR